MGSKAGRKLSRPAEASSFHDSEILGPASGNPDTHPGGGGRPSVSRVFAKAVARSTFSRMVTMARVIGTIRSASSPAVMIATAAPRFPPSMDCRRSRIGQVATTMMTAQTKDGRNGFRIQKLAAMSKPMKSTASVVRVRSRAGRGVVIDFLFPGILSGQAGAGFPGSLHRMPSTEAHGILCVKSLHLSSRKCRAGADTETVICRNPAVKKLTRRCRCGLVAELTHASCEAIFY